MTAPVAVRVLELLTARQETLATAESLTGGLIGGLLTGVPGASACYLGGVISYASRLKTILAGVTEQTLAKYGPVAEPTAAEMALGVAARCSADWGLAATGVAGPDLQEGHRVGQVFVAVAQPSTGYSRVVELALSGTRAHIRERAAVDGLELLAQVLGMNTDTSRVVRDG